MKLFRPGVVMIALKEVSKIDYFKPDVQNALKDDHKFTLLRVERRREQAVRKIMESLSDFQTTNSNDDREEQNSYFTQDSTTSTNANHKHL